jgi:hypothetical protein
MFVMRCIYNRRTLISVLSVYIMIKILLLFIFFIIVQIALKPITLKNIDTQQPPLADLGHKLIPSIDPNNMLICDAILVFMFIVMFVFIDSPKVLAEFFRKGSWILFLRSISIMLTDFPQLNTHLCSVKNKIDSNCSNDYMFSGHTSITLLIALFVAKSNTSLCIPMIVIFVLQVTLILSTRMHYSIDVFIAMVLTSCMYKLKL